MCSGTGQPKNDAQTRNWYADLPGLLEAEALWHSGRYNEPACIEIQASKPLLTAFLRDFIFSEADITVSVTPDRFTRETFAARELYQLSAAIQASQLVVADTETMILPLFAGPLFSLHC
jgi:hypothetical protein